MIVEALLGPGGAETAALLLFRITGLFLVAPLFSARVVPMPLKAALVVLLVLMILPAGVREGGAGLEVNPGAVISELLVGFALGLAAGILIHGAEVAGDFVAVQTGLSGANLLDPLSETQMPVLGQFMGLTVMAGFLTVGGHLVVLDSLIHSLAVVPQGALVSPLGVQGVVETGGRLFVLGLRIAAPVIAAVTIGNVALGVLARTVPQMNVLMTAFPLQIGIGLLVLAASLPLVGTLVLSWPGELRHISDELLLMLAPDVPEGHE